jgi:hypothetical protein
VGKHDWQHILEKNIIGIKFNGKNILGSTYWGKHNWQHILGKKT